MIQHGQEHRWHATQYGRLFVVDGLQHRHRVECFIGINNDGTGRHTGQRDAYHARTVIKWKRADEHILLGQPDFLAGEHGIVEKVEVGQRRPFWRTGGAAGKLNIEGIIRLQHIGQLCKACDGSGVRTIRDLRKREETDPT